LGCGLLCSGTAFIAAPAFAAELVAGVYLGGGLSFSNVTDLDGKIDAANANQGQGTTSSADGSKTNGNLRLGCRINPNLAVEATYDQVGGMNVQSTVASRGADVASGTWKSNGRGMHVLGILPVGKDWSVYGRVGVEQRNTLLNLASTQGGATGPSSMATNNTLTLGAGAAYAESHKLDATDEYLHYNRVGDDALTGSNGVDKVNVGLLYHFM
jgi:OmpA-OmpF porin, OOP family